MRELELLEQVVTFGDEDVEALRMSYPILEDQVESILDAMLGFMRSLDQLMVFFSDPKTGEVQEDYLDAIRPRVGQWILDTARAEYDQQWLDYQFEIGRRHHRTGKNTTDMASATEQVDFRYLPALIVPLTTTLRSFLANKGHRAADVERMHAAWVKSVTLQVILWSFPYVTPGDF